VSRPVQQLEEPLVVRPSGFFLVSAFFSPALLVTLGLWGWWRVGELRTTSGVLLVVGLFLTVTVLADLPYRVVFGPEGVSRVCPLRRQRLAWDDVTALSRTRVDRGASRLFGRAVSGLRSQKVGGLVVLVGPKRRRYLLTDRQERPDEYHELKRRIGVWAPGVPVPAGPR
jgi:hypothetical protein